MRKIMTTFLLLSIFNHYAHATATNISGELQYPWFALFHGNAEVILKDVKTGEIVERTQTDGKNRFLLHRRPDPLLSIVAYTRSGKKFIGEYSLWGFRGGRVIITMMRSENAITLLGSVKTQNGLPARNCLISIDTAPCDERQFPWFPVRVVFTDNNGNWKLENVKMPRRYAVMGYLKEPRLVAQPPYYEEPLSAAIMVHGNTHKRILRQLSVPLITENMRRKLGTMVDSSKVSLPVSTNNVIYVGDIVLQSEQ